MFAKIDTKQEMKKKLFLLAIFTGLLFVLDIVFSSPKQPAVLAEVNKTHWFLLHRKSNVEYFYYGVPGDKESSDLLNVFIVKTGIPGERPTPLPQLVGRDYWVIISKEEQQDNPETAPYFLTLDVPVGEEEPYGPIPYEECHGQCNWIVPGAFGLHGTGGDPSKLESDNPGSSGCIRHSDEAITYLYQTLDPQKEEIRYYIVD